MLQGEVLIREVSRIKDILCRGSHTASAHLERLGKAKKRRATRRAAQKDGVNAVKNVHRISDQVTRAQSHFPVSFIR